MIFKRKKESGNRRKFERIDFFQQSYCKYLEKGDEDILYDCFLKNISMNGLSFYTKDKSLDDNILLLYRIGTKYRNDKIIIKNESRFLNDWRYGCQFIDPNEVRDSLIEEYISKFNNE